MTTYRVRRRWRPAVITATLALLAAALPGSAAAVPLDQAQPAPANQPPNIVLVLTDDLEPSLLRFMPQVRAMQKTGASFSNYTVSNSLCCPSRSSILTGQYPHTSGIFTNAGDDGGHPEFQERGLENQTFAVALQAAGYQTSFLGKYLNGYNPIAGDGTPGSNVPPGWTNWAVGGNAYANYHYVLNENGAEVAYGNQRSDYLTDVLARKANDLIRSADKAGQPFAIEVSTYTPHSPYTPAPRHAHLYPGLKAPRTPAFNENDMSDKPAWIRSRPRLTKSQIAALDRAYRKRAQSVRAIDDMIGRIRATLAATGQAENTYLVFTADNGYHMGEHRLLTGKQTAYTTDIVVPLVVIGPEVRHRSVGQLAQNIDLAATFVDLAGAPALTTDDGRSLRPLLEGGNPADWRTGSLIEHHGPNNQPNDPDRVRGGANPPTYSALVTHRVTYVEYVDGAREYYDNRKDPYQLQNAYRSLTADKRQALSARLAELVGCTGTADCSVG